MASQLLKSCTLKKLIRGLVLHQLVLLQLLCIDNCKAELLHYKDFSDITSLSLQQESKIKSANEHTIMLLPNPDPSWRTDSNLQKTSTWSGWMMYKQPIPFVSVSESDSGSQRLSQSFNTSFTFRLITNATSEDSPSGMTFFITTNGGSPTGSSNMFFGLANYETVDPATNPFFAVEFDTFKSESTNDPSYSHIGIDISSANSAKLTDTSNNSSNGHYPELYLYSGYKFICWISYDSSSHITKVWMTNRSTEFANSISPPENELQPIMELKYDLYSVFSAQNSTYVGFSAATQSDSDMLGVELYSWYLWVDNNITVPDNTNTIIITQKSYRYEIIIPLAIVAIISTGSVVAVALYCKRRLHKYRVFKINDGSIDNLSSQSAVAGKPSSNYSIISCCSSKLKLMNETDANDDMSYTTAVNLPHYSYQELQLSTNGFHRNTLIGEGGFSKVHKGTLQDGSVVAIKRLKDGIRKEVEFSAELKMINSIRHRNLLQLQGWSYENGEALLVYKFISNGSLNAYLFGEKRGTLDSDTRLRILSGVAAALEYLHFGLGDCVLHRDVKAANVLLTENFEPVLGDFGLARLIKHNETVTATMVGTVGYVAPEVVVMGKVTEKADVYSFGVLVLEVVSGCKALSNGPLKLDHQVYLVEQVSQLVQNNGINQAVDPFIIQLESIKSSGSNVAIVKHQWERVIHLALVCCHQNPESRPNMRYVNQEIQNIINGIQSLPLPIASENAESLQAAIPVSNSLQAALPVSESLEAAISTDPSWTYSSDFLVRPR